jgi:hypothetical protein
MRCGLLIKRRPFIQVPTLRFALTLRVIWINCPKSVLRFIFKRTTLSTASEVAGFAGKYVNRVPKLRSNCRLNMSYTVHHFAFPEEVGGLELHHETLMVRYILVCRWVNGEE